MKKLFSALITFFSIAISLYFGFFPREDREISYLLNTIPVLKRASSGQLQLYDDNGERVTSSVYATEITIWNSGSVSILKDDIRTPATIAPIKGRILSADIVAVSDNDAAFSVSLLSGKATLTWKFLDPGYTCVVRVLTEESDALSISGKFNRIDSLTARSTRGIDPLWRGVLIANVGAAFGQVIGLSLNEYVGLDKELRRFRLRAFWGIIVAHRYAFVLPILLAVVVAIIFSDPSNWFITRPRKTSDIF